MAQAADVDSTITADNDISQNNTDDSKTPIQKISIAVTAKIYPNPVRDELNISGLDPKTKTHISVASSYGKIVYQCRTSGSETYKANVQRLRPGLYYITIKAGDESMLLKFLKE